MCFYFQRTFIPVYLNAGGINPHFVGIETEIEMMLASTKSQS